MAHYDILIIGTGSGNSIVDDRFAHLKVAIAEEWHFGGTCLNVGCIPTKMLVLPAEAAAAATDSTRLNVASSFNGVDWPGLRDRIFGRIDAIEADGRDYRTNRLDYVTVYPEHVRFTGRYKAVTESGETITFDHVIIAAGSHPTRLEAPGLDWDEVDTPVYPVRTSDTIMRIDTLPKRLVIIGSGFIAAEFAHVFSSFGVDVTVMVRGDRMLGSHDEDVSRAFTDEFSRHVNVRTGIQAKEFHVSQSGVVIDVEATGRVEGATTSALEADMVLVAVGRTRTVEALGLEHLGADVEGDRIVVDSYQRVLSQGEPLGSVYALGDISSEHLLKHVANREARTVQHNVMEDFGLIKGRVETSYHALPAAVFSHPQVGTVGATEQQLRASGVDYVTATQEYSSVAYGWALGDEFGLVKALIDRQTKQILGAHVLGAQAATLVQLFVEAMTFEIPADQLAHRPYWIHPALTEVVENALLQFE